MSKTKARAQESVFWPGINNEIEQLVEQCAKCHNKLPSQQQETMVSDDVPTRAFESVASDLFSLGGKTFMVCVDAYSGYPLVKEFRQEPDSETLIEVFKEWFSEKGYPSHFRSDQGTVYSSKKFQEYLEHYGIKWSPLSPTYAQSNGMAESNVKSMKHLLTKMEKPSTKSTEYYDAILEYRNTPRDKGLSPNQVLYGHNVKSTVPTHSSAMQRNFDPEVTEKIMDTRDERARYYNLKAKDLPKLNPGNMVCIQDSSSKLWNKEGEVIDVSSTGRSYKVLLSNGKKYWRNRRFIRPVTQDTAPKMDDTGLPHSTTRNDTTNDMNHSGAPNGQIYKAKLRKSPKKTIRFNI